MGRTRPRPEPVPINRQPPSITPPAQTRRRPNHARHPLAVDKLGHLSRQGGDPVNFCGYIGNFVGSMGLVGLVFLSHHLDMNGGRVGLSMLTTAVAKISPDVMTLFFK